MLSQFIRSRGWWGFSYSMVMHQFLPPFSLLPPLSPKEKNDAILSNLFMITVFQIWVVIRIKNQRDQ